MDKTQNFEFNIPSGNDYYNVEDFNENFRKIDREIMSAADVQEAVGRKADSQQFAAHTANNTVHITAAERGKWNGKQDAMTVDAQLNATSANPVQNKAVTAAIGAKADQQALNAHTGNGTIHVTAADKVNWNGKQNAMTIDTQLNAASTNPVQNKAVTAAVAAKASQQDLNSHTGNSTVHITAAERASWNGKQNAMTVDAQLNATSANPVQNKAVTAAVAAKASQQDLNSHTGNGTVHITAAERASWNGKQNAMTVDAQLNAASTNPVQNKAVAAAIGEISSDLGGLRFGVDADGNYGYIQAGADTVTPFKHIIYLGRGSQNLKSYPGYQNFTMNNFLIGAVSIDVTLDGGDVNSSAGSKTVTVTQSASYNASNGILTVSSNRTGQVMSVSTNIMVAHTYVQTTAMPHVWLVR